MSVGFPRQECWSGLSFPPPGDLPDPGMEPASPESPASAGRFFTTVLSGKPIVLLYFGLVTNMTLFCCSNQEPVSLTQLCCCVCDKEHSDIPFIPFKFY